MAESVVTFYLEKLSDLIIREANLLKGVDEQIYSLRDELNLIRSYLKDADARRIEDERAKVWVNQVIDVVHDAEDVIDEFILKVERQRRSTLRRCFGSINQLKTLYDVRNRNELIKSRVEKISGSRSRYGIEVIQSGEPSDSFNQGLSMRPKRHPMVEEADVVGIEDDAKTLVKQLVGGEARLCVISIVGMCGLGKTTLAKKVYNMNYVNKHFDCRAWVCLSQEYRFREVLMGIIKQVLIPGEEKLLEKMDEYGLGKELFMYLKKRRYLVVVDDIWSIEAWDSLEAIFPERAKGSRVMLTTRNKEVAVYANSIPHELKCLSEEDCWELFSRIAFSQDVTNVLSADLEKIGRAIVKKAGGLPLAVAVLGGFLSRKDQIPSEWERVLKHLNWQLDDHQNQIFNVLSLSYNSLPYFLKSCLLYIGIFPQDYEIPARKLIQLWVAEGLVQQQGEETMEETAENYLEELIGRSLVQVSKRRSNGGIKTCHFHELFREFSISEAKKYKFFDVHQSAEFTSPTRARRLIIHGSIDKYMSLNRPTPHLRALLHFNSQIYGKGLGIEHWRIFFRGFRLLRVLDLPRVTITKLPAEICEMIHLRYLGLRDGLLRRIPSTISNLVNLQTLDIKHRIASGLCQVLPGDISKMDQLRHLYMTSGKISGRFKIDCLKNLHTLSDILAGGWIEEGLAKLTNLRKLRVRGILNSHKEALSDSIVKVGGLQSLSLEWKEDVTMPTLILLNHVRLYKLHLIGRLEKLPEMHEFPPVLTHLFLSHSGLMHDPMATLEKLPHLKILKLSQNTFMGMGMVCAAGGFPQLKELDVSSFYNLEEWRVEEGAMLSLTRLKISMCFGLKMLPEGLRHITTLQVLELIGISAELRARILIESGEDFYKVQHVPSLVIHG